MKKILITGATGFLGRNFIEEIISTDEYEIIGISRNCQKIDGIRFIQADLLEITNIERVIENEKPDILLLLAWDVSPNIYWQSFNNHLWADSCIQLSEIFLHNGGKTIVFAGTSASYDYQYGYLTERLTPECPASLYGEAKLYTSHILQKLSFKYNARYAEARLFSIYGKYEHSNRLITKTIDTFETNGVVQNSKWDLYRDYIYVKDAAKAIKLLIENESASGVYNVSSGQPISIHEILETIAKQLDCTNRLEFITPDTFEENKLIVGNNHKISELGFKCNYDIWNGIEESIEYRRASHK